jgi:hypothetical protein
LYIVLDSPSSQDCVNPCLCILEKISSKTTIPGSNYPRMMGDATATVTSVASVLVTNLLDDQMPTVFIPALVKFLCLVDNFHFSLLPFPTTPL